RRRATIPVTARDATGTPSVRDALPISTTGDGNTLTQPAGLTNSQGVATGTLRSTVAEAKTVSATIDGVDVTQTATVTVTVGAVRAGQPRAEAAPRADAAGRGRAANNVT